MEHMKIYISGKITGLPILEAQEIFEKAVIDIRKRGHIAVSPSWISGILPGMDWTTYMTIAYGIIHDPSVEAVYMLKNWKESRGAIIEWGWAQARGLPVFYQNPADYIKYERSAQ